MNLNEKLKNYLTHEENDFLKVENSYNKKTSYLVGFEFAKLYKQINKNLSNLFIGNIFNPLFHIL